MSLNRLALCAGAKVGSNVGAVSEDKAACWPMSEQFTLIFLALATYLFLRGSLCVSLKIKVFKNS